MNFKFFRRDFIIVEDKASIENLQEHVKLEVALEIIMAKLADAIFEMTKDNNIENEKKKKKLTDIQEKAYEGNPEIINSIIKGEI